MEKFFVLLPFKEFESSKYFRFNKFFLGVGAGDFRKSNVLDLDFYENLLLNEYEFNYKFSEKKFEFSSDASDDSSLSLIHI